MEFDKNRQLGDFIIRLIAKQDLTREESYEGFRMVLNNEVTDMQQGAFLAALTAKGETAAEVAGGWQAVYDLDTKKVALDGMEVVDNCGTGMDTFKTFNISTAASLVAAAGGVKIARHGARAITSSCGTVDMAEYFGVDMECDVETVARSIKETGIGLFNGMSPRVHPMALSRILSQICFGSPLNIAASMANPALPKIAVRGVYSPALLRPVAEVMQSIGYRDAVVVYGAISGSEKGMDEASVCGQTHGIHLREGKLTEISFEPEQCGLKKHDAAALAADPDRKSGAVKMCRLLAGKGDRARCDAVALNSALIFYVRGMVETIEKGVEKAQELLLSGQALKLLTRWVEVQNSDPAKGLQKLADLQKISEITP
ncbi:MAG: anthranilate phosphoribosyltransferase [Deltaproteobacteria bacterium]|nr:anthranilate phosphoribosyltransferase [Deltaproteobacteria bacterium]